MDLLSSFSRAQEVDRVQGTSRAEPGPSPAVPPAPILGTITGSALPTLAATYQWVIAYSGDPNNKGAGTTKGNTPEVAVGPGATVVGSALYLVGGNSNDQVHVKPLGVSLTGATGIQVDANLNHLDLDHLMYPQAFTTLYIIGFNGNDEIHLDEHLTIATVVSVGNGNDHLELGNGNNIVTAGNGNDEIEAGDGNNTITVGNGNDASAHLPADAALYAVAYRPVVRDQTELFEAWPHALALGQPLPTVPLALNAELCLPIDLEATYVAACRRRRLA